MGFGEQGWNLTARDCKRGFAGGEEMSWAGSGEGVASLTLNCVPGRKCHSSCSAQFDGGSTVVQR